MSAPAIELRGLRKTFGDVEAVAGIDLEIPDGEFFSLLGPSGSGKTTLLRMIAGFELPTDGQVLLQGVDVTRRPPYDRDVNTVFQDYALFPHLSVLGNVEYGLRVKGVGKRERRERAEQALTSVRLTGFGDRRPGQLSGGQRQRVALARALVNRPKVLLLDEPLGALDRALRLEMQVELKQLQRDVGITFVLVTHDQDEALTMSDRVAVVRGGRIEQIDTPAGLYERPRTDFVAGFVGVTNLLSGATAAAILGDEATVSIRPEKIRIAALSDASSADGSAAEGTVREEIYLGASTRYVVDLDAGGQLVVQRQNEGDTGDSADGHRFDRGDRVRVSWHHSHALPVNGEQPALTTP
ncbi:ABC transporter ATP-binding protein [Cryptosporangium aurantiacum]|uniref:Putative spermidine/putrescine transport system ATP-binding protein n=1 Tax=Cryptosporangium aurantiacum TaxID=134849 RepID=A0A1M7RMJ9_9ACTN|nr:ABC transporter ATP-binding protein [Cryptosporangium aurantiacum]SHN47557.1 putative spermidine/putrescine transport system ATP-binding protein [Cryptosporangium aurantiacum]